MATMAESEGGKPPWGSRRFYAIAVPAALAVAAGGTALYLYLAPVRPAAPPPVADPTETTLAEDVLARAAPLVRAGLVEDAVRLMRTYVRSDARDTEVRPVLAGVLLRAGRTAEAEQTIDELLRLTPRSAKAAWLKGQAVRARGGKEAGDYFRFAVEKGEGAGPEIWCYYGLLMLDEGERKEAEAYLRRALEAGLKDARTLGGLGELELQAGRYEQAEKLLAEAVTHENAPPELFARLAEAQKNLGRLNEADRNIDQALAARPSGRLYLMKGDICVLRRLRQEAAEAYARAADDPDMGFEGAMRAARIYYSLDRYVQAMKYAGRAVELRPESQEAADLLRRIEEARMR